MCLNTDYIAKDSHVMSREEPSYTLEADKIASEKLREATYGLSKLSVEGCSLTYYQVTASQV